MNYVEPPPITSSEDKSSAFINRIRKNYKHVRKWAKRSLTNCFRVYDRDIKEYPFVIDFYAGRFCVQFFSYDKDQDEPREEVKSEIDQALISTFQVSPDLIYWKTRIKRKKTQQYEKLAQEEEFFTVFEYGAKFKVNLEDYLDTGLFLDHRETRQRVARLAKNKSVLNLFAYTCSFSVQAALAGAKSTQSVDMSNTYTDWGIENFVLNSLSLKNNRVIKADCLKFIDDAVFDRAKFDIIIIDPPTISRSKKMDQLFDIQVDYVPLIEKSLKLLSSDGIIFFSTNSRKFKLDTDLLPPCNIREISDKTLPIDFHNKKIHRCWEITQDK
jgi:23S rRNA (cytosine1962-C5)-methyltransferase